MIKEDKIMHFSAGYFTCRIVTFFAPVYIGLALCIIMAISKEVYDKRIKHTFFSVPDMVATIIGGIFSLILTVIDNLLKHSFNL